MGSPTYFSECIVNLVDGVIWVHEAAGSIPVTPTCGRVKRICKSRWAHNPVIARFDSRVRNCGVRLMVDRRIVVPLVRVRFSYVTLGAYHP